MRDITQFKERFQRWKKTGELPYEAGRIKNADSNREELVYEDSLSLSALPAYEGGKDGAILNHDYANDVFTGAKLFDGQDIVVTGNKKNIKRSYIHPWKTIDRVRLEAFDDEILRRRQELAALGMSNTLYNLYKNDLSKPLSPVDPVGEFAVSAVALDPAFKYLFSGTGEILKDIAYNIKPVKNYVLSNALKKDIDTGMKALSPTEKFFNYINEDIPEYGLITGYKALQKDPVVLNLKQLGVDTDKLTFQTLKKFKNKLEFDTASDLHVGGRKAFISEGGKHIKLFDNAKDLSGDPFEIGDLRLESGGISQQNAAASLLSNMNAIPYSDWLNRHVRGVHMIQNLSDALPIRRKYVGLDLYNAALDNYIKDGGFGILSGKELLSPEATYRTINLNNFQMIKYPNAGYHYLRTPSGSKGSIGDVNIITKPYTRIVPYKTDYTFDINQIDDFGNLLLDWTTR